MPVMFHRTDDRDARGYPVYLIGYRNEPIPWSPDASPEVFALLHVMALNRCWVDLSVLAPEGAAPDKARDAVQKRLVRAVRAIAAVVPELEMALSFQTASDCGRVVGRIRGEAPRVDTAMPGVGVASFSRRPALGISVQPGT